MTEEQKKTVNWFKWLSVVLLPEIGIPWIGIEYGSKFLGATARGIANATRATAKAISDRREKAKQESEVRRRNAEIELLRPNWKLEEAQQKEEQKRRSEARASVQWFYHLYWPEIYERFPSDRYNNYVAQFLSDSKSAEDVERHADALIDLMERHREAVKPSRKIATMQALDEWYQQARRAIESSSVEDPLGEFKETQLHNLRKKYKELMNKLREEMTE